MKKFIKIVLITVIFLFCFSFGNGSERSFTINYAENSFYMDGKPFQYVSGSVHYFRMPNEYWKDRLRKMKAVGLNAISTYVEWNQHESVEGQFKFDDDLDIVKFIKMAQEENLYVILRPGPYICAERDMGGLPYWLMSKHPDIQLRSSDKNYTKYVKRWLDVLFDKLSSLFYGRGGPIILVQVENEYGSYHACDSKHLIWLRDLFVKHVKNNSVLFTTDGASASFLKCGKIPGVYATVDFGPNSNVTKMFESQREFEPNGPLVNSEYYPGWLTHWGENKMARQKTEDVIRTLKQMLEKNANVNFYMFYGGSNFGFTAGANFGDFYQSDVTSYDYDAPITESGDLTDKYFAIRDILHQHFKLDSTINVNISDKGDYGEIILRRTATIFSTKLREALGKLQRNTEPLTFEELHQNFGYVLYETLIPQKLTNLSSNLLVIQKLRDLAHVYMDNNYLGNLSREHRTTSLKIKVLGKKLSIMVENLGRINFGSYLNDKKGILSEVTLTGKKLLNWNMTSFNLNTLNPIMDCFNRTKIFTNDECDNGQGFVFYVQKFTLSNNALDRDHVKDSFLDLRNLTKGLVFINDFNLGRYWSTRGPQYSLYVPGVYLKPYPEENIIIVLEENITVDNIKINFTTAPIFS